MTATPTTPFDPDAAAGAASGIFGLPHRPDEARVVVVPVPFDATTSYRKGAARGPAAVLAASRQVDLFDLETGEPWTGGIAMLPESEDVAAWNARATELAQPIIDAGGVPAGEPATTLAAALAAAAAEVSVLGGWCNEWLERTVAERLEQGRLVATVGGDHATAFGAIAAHARRFPGMGVLHLDAHADLRVAYEGFTWSHASIMHNVLDRLPGVGRIVAFGIRDVGRAERDRIASSYGRVVAWTGPELHARLFAGEPWERIADLIAADLPRDVYLSFDIDGLDAWLCPHTGTPVPGGLDLPQVNAVLAAVVRSGRRIVGLDLMEVAPGPDGDDWDGNVGARLLYKMIGFALLSQGEGEPPPRL